jgi:hypothetical protein
MPSEIQTTDFHQEKKKKKKKKEVTTSLLYNDYFLFLLVSKCVFSSFHFLSAPALSAKNPNERTNE